MEVTCDRCQAEYEFEETLIADGGTTVKCTNCGHLFKVHPRGSGSGLARVEAPVLTRWTIRAANGETRPARSLAEIVRLIRAGDLGPDHSISHSGKSWKRLGDIDELSKFFQPREDAEAEPEPDANRPLPVFVESQLIPPAHRPPLAQPGLPTPRTIVAVGETLPDPTVAPVTTDTPAESWVERSHGEARTRNRGTGLARRPASPLDPPTARGNSDDHSHMDRLSDPLPEPLLSDLDHGEATRGGKRRTWSLFLLVAAAASAAGVWGWPRLQGRTPPEVMPANPAQRFVERADRALAAYRPDQFELAVTEYTKALAFREDDPHLLSSVARAYARWAQQLRIRAELMKAGLLSHSPATLTRLTAESGRLGARAKQAATTAARKNPGNTEAEVALADALRLSGNLVAARAELDRARRNETTASAETLRVAAHLAIAEAGQDLSAGMDFASQAVAQEPEELVFRVLLVHILLAKRDLETARYHLRALKGQAPGDPMVTALDEALAASRDQPAVRTRAHDAQRVDAGSPSPSREDEDDGEHEGKGADEPQPDSEAQARVRSLAQQGERLLEQGMTTRAERAFRQALDLAPGSRRAQTGLAYVLLERGRYREAHSWFRKASRAGYPEAFIGLGATLRNLDRPKGALRAYRTYARRFPGGRSASIAQRQIQRLEEQLKKGN